VAAGTTVIVGTHSAMWDEDAVPQPNRFDPRRAGSTYLIFGSGVHRCAGEHIMSAQLPSMLAPLLALSGLRRQAGSAGRLHWTGPRPDGLVVTVQ
jgi:cytochrome P450